MAEYLDTNLLDLSLNFICELRSLRLLIINLIGGLDQENSIYYKFSINFIEVRHALARKSILRHRYVWYKQQCYVYSLLTISTNISDRFAFGVCTIDKAIEHL